MAKYILTSKVTGKTVLTPGTPVDLSAEQAAHPFWKNRVRKADSGARLEPATPSASTGEKKPTKADIAKRLKELEIDFDGRKSAEELAELLPDGDPLKSATE